MFRALTENHKILGFELKTPMAYLFFGTRHVGRLDLPLLFPQYDFRFLTQEHGSRIVQQGPSSSAQSEAFTADAHWTQESNIALSIQTADCLPVLMAGPNGVAACHAGWRGIELDIAAKTYQLLQARDITPELVAVGPHIHFESFEVSTDIADRLTGHFHEDSASHDLRKNHRQDPKAYIHLYGLVRQQLRRAGGEKLQIRQLSENTFDSDLFHSYRRDGQLAGRQYSFIVIPKALR